MLLLIYKKYPQYVYEFMYDGRDKNTNSQTNVSFKYLSKTHGGVMQNKIYCN